MRSTHLLALLALPLMLSACNSESRFLRDDPAFNHPISISSVPREHRIGLDLRGNLDAPADAWMAMAVDYTRRGDGRMTVSGNTRDVQIAARRLVDSGVPTNSLHLLPARSGERGVSIRYSSREATTNPCGTFATDGREWASLLNRPSSEWGCSTQNNLAAMISNPNDLIRRRGSETVYGAGPGRSTGSAADWGVYERPAVPAASASGNAASGGGR